MSLPALLNEIADVAGVEAALIVAREKGGERVYIPARVRSGHWLERAVGLDVASKIARHFAQDGVGAYLDIPLGPGGSYVSQRRSRAQALAAATRAGLSANRTARAVGVSRRAVFEHRAKLRERDGEDQPDLFGDDTGG